MSYLTRLLGLRSPFWDETGRAFEVGIGGFIGGLAFIFAEPWGPSKDWKDYQTLTDGEKSSIDVFVSTLPEGGGTLDLRYQR
jgi:hypothetical protein